MTFRESVIPNGNNQAFEHLCSTIKADLFVFVLQPLFRESRRIRVQSANSQGVGGVSYGRVMSGFLNDGLDAGLPWVIAAGVSMTRPLPAYPASSVRARSAKMPVYYLGSEA